MSAAQEKLAILADIDQRIPLLRSYIRQLDKESAEPELDAVVSSLRTLRAIEERPFSLYEDRLREILAAMEPSFASLAAGAVKVQLEEAARPRGEPPEWNRHPKVTRVKQLCNRMEMPFVHAENFIRALTMMGSEGWDGTEKSAVWQVATAALDYVEELHEHWRRLHDVLAGREEESEEGEVEEDELEDAEATA